MNEKSAEVITLGCRLPNGYVLEVGLQTTVKIANGLMPQLRRTPSYQRVRLGGTHDHTRGVRRQGIQVPAMLNAEPFLTRNVPKALWDRWKSEHQGAWVLKSGNIFEVKDVKDERSLILDSMAMPAVFQPVDPSKAIKVGDSTIEKANFEEEK